MARSTWSVATGLGIMLFLIFAVFLNICSGQDNYWAQEGLADEPLPILLWTAGETSFPLQPTLSSSAFESYERCTSGHSAAEALLPSFEPDQGPKSVVIFVQDWLRIEDLTTSSKNTYKYLKSIYGDECYKGSRHFIPQAHDAFLVCKAHFTNVDTALLEIDDYTEPETFAWPTDLFPNARLRLIIVHLITGSEVVDELLLRRKDEYMRVFVETYLKDDPSTLCIFTGKHFRSYESFYHAPSQLRVRRQILRQHYADDASVVSLDGACVDVVGHNGHFQQSGGYDGPLPAQSRTSTSDTCSDDNSTQSASFNMLTNSSTLETLRLRFVVTTDNNTSQWQLSNLTATFFSKIAGNKSEGTSQLLPSAKIMALTGETYNSSGPVTFSAPDGSIRLKFDSLWVIPYDSPGTFGKLPLGPDFFSPGVLMGLITSFLAIVIVIWAMEYIVSIEPMDSLHKKQQNLPIRGGED